MTGKVVHVLKDSYDLYIGRRNHRHGLHDSVWGNPYIIGEDGTREEVIQKYREYVLADPYLRRHVSSLRGRVLGCWCAPKPCHGDVLLELAETHVETRPEDPASVIVVNQQGDTLHDGYAVMWRGLTVAQAQAICSDERTQGTKHFLAWTSDANLASKPKAKNEEGWHWFWARDDGRYDEVLVDLGISVERAA